MTDTHDAVALVETMIDAVGLTRDTPEPRRGAMLDQLHAEVASRIADPDLRNAAFQYLDHWRAQP